jgi:integrase
VRAPFQDVRVWAVQHRPAKSKPYGVRWVVDGEPYSKWFRTRAEAERRRSRMQVAQQDGERFDPRTGEPESWSPTSGEMRVYEWARRWVAEEWAEWAPRTRRSQLEALARFLPLVIDPKAPEAPLRPAALRSYLVTTLPPDADLDSSAAAEQWLARWGLALGELTEELLADVDRRLGLGTSGQQLAVSTAGRFRKVAHGCIRRAVELKKIPADPWPPTPKGRAKRKARRQRKAVDVKRLPDPPTMASIIAAIRSHQPGSRNYELMTATSYYAGLRPSEVAMLRPRALRLPGSGWGAVEVTEADDGYDEPAEPKTGDRTVPIPPVLVEMLRAWVAEHDLGPSELLFRTRRGRRPAPSNWLRALHRACCSAGFRPLRPYDARHACATTWLRAGMPLGEAALRLGHSVETLVSYYVGALQGDDQIANDRVNAAFAAQVVGWVLTICWLLPKGTSLGSDRATHQPVCSAPQDMRQPSD